MTEKTSTTVNKTEEQGIPRPYGRKYLGYDDMTEALYNLSGNELRRLAFEALLISDGPDKAPEHAPTEDATVNVGAVQYACGPNCQTQGFILTVDVLDPRWLQP